MGRSLSNIEIESIIEPIAEKIPWYDAICNAIEMILDDRRKDTLRGIPENAESELVAIE